jgi:hypothetical protein
MCDQEEAGSDRVTACTRAFEEIDAQVFPGPGRGATQSEAAASDRWGAPSAHTVEAYRRMFDVVAKHQRAHGARRAGATAGSGLGRTPERTPESDGGDDSGPTVEKANVVDWGAVPRGAVSDVARQLGGGSRLSAAAAAPGVPHRVQPAVAIR